MTRSLFSVVIACALVAVVFGGGKHPQHTYRPQLQTQHPQQQTQQPQQQTQQQQQQAQQQQTQHVQQTVFCATASDIGQTQWNEYVDGVSLQVSCTSGKKGSFHTEWIACMDDRTGAVVPLTLLSMINMNSCDLQCYLDGQYHGVIVRPSRKC